MMDDMNFWNPKFFGFVVLPIGVVDICWVETPRRHPFGLICLFVTGVCPVLSTSFEIHHI